MSHWSKRQRKRLVFGKIQDGKLILLNSLGESHPAFTPVDGSDRQEMLNRFNAEFPNVEIRFDLETLPDEDDIFQTAEYRGALSSHHTMVPRQGCSKLFDIQIIFFYW